jgi:Fic family protein
MSSETYFTATAAAKQLGVSNPTFQKYLKAGKFPNAKQTPKGKRLDWQIPLSDLQASGLLDRVTAAPNQPSEALTAPQNELGELRLRLAHTEELLRRADAELEAYRRRELTHLLAIETRETQQRRRFSWFTRNPQDTPPSP